jgi:hypothetical protein
MTLDCPMLLVEKGFRHDLMVDLGDFVRASALGFSCPIGSSREPAFELRLWEFRVDAEIIFNIDVD